MLFLLAYSDWQGPISHWSAHVADTEVVELESLLLLICNFQELCVLAILQEPLAHARLVLTPVDANDCRDSKIHLGFSPRRRSTGNGTFSGGIALFSTTESFLMLVPK